MVDVILKSYTPSASTPKNVVTITQALVGQTIKGGNLAQFNPYSQAAKDTAKQAAYDTRKKITPTIKQSKPTTTNSSTPNILNPTSQPQSSAPPPFVQMGNDILGKGVSLAPNIGSSGSFNTRPSATTTNNAATTSGSDTPTDGKSLNDYLVIGLLAVVGLFGLKKVKMI